MNSLNNAGMSIKTAMGLVGHKTMSVYNRYGITDEKDLRRGGAMLASYFDESHEAAEHKVVPLHPDWDTNDFGPRYSSRSPQKFLG